MDYKFLGKINSPAELKKLNADEITVLCSEIRDKIINTVSLNGGHLASNLGTVELTVALHSVFNAPKDSIIFDVGHQSYTHKLLTGRYDKFDTLRKDGGISGFLRPNESKYDPIVTGHSSNSVSAACGIAKANAMLNNNNYSVVVIGDGALTGGMAYEGFNNSVDCGKNLIIVINDNKMSISKNVGAFHRSLEHVRMNPSYYRMKRVIEKVIRRIPFIGTKLRNSIYNSKVMLKNVIYHDNIFESMGFNYFGPIDGHNVEKLKNVFQVAKNSKNPVVVHALTVKGKGYKYAEVKPGSYHGVAPFDVEVGLENGDGTDFSKEFGKSLCSIAKYDKKICAVSAAMSDGTGLNQFADDYSDRFFDVGISEQHAVTFCTGLAVKGFKPYFAVYSSFLQRGFDQVLHDAAIANLPITLCIDRAGLVGNDGETHQGLFDISFLSAIPNVSIFAPSTYEELHQILKLSAKRKSGVWAIRYPKGSEIPLEIELYPDKPYVCLSNNSDVAVVSYGVNFSICKNAVEGSDMTADLFKLNRLNNLPFDLINQLSEYKKVFVFEESVKQGSVGQNIASLLAEHGFNGIFKHTAIENSFVSQATVKEQRIKYHLDESSIVNIISGGKDGR